MKAFLKRLLFYLAILALFFVAYLAYLYDDAVSVSKGFPIGTYENPTTALLVIDIQEGTTGEYSEDKSYKEQSSTLINNVNEVITTMHESGFPVVYIRQQTENWFLNWADGYVLAEGYPGVAIDSRVKIISMNHFPKRIMDAFSNPLLDEFLKELQVERLVITGLDIGACAKKTSLAALNRGYEVVIVNEAVISTSEKKKQEQLEELRSAGANVLEIDRLQDLFEF
jgi:nicotinamidase-related amidase